MGVVDRPERKQPAHRCCFCPAALRPKQAQQTCSGKEKDTKAKNAKERHIAISLAFYR